MNNLFVSTNLKCVLELTNLAVTDTYMSKISVCSVLHLISNWTSCRTLLWAKNSRTVQLFEGRGRRTELWKRRGEQSVFIFVTEVEAQILRSLQL